MSDQHRSELEDELAGAEHLSPEEKAERQRLAGERRLLRDTALVQLMSQPWFREWIMALLIEFGTFRSIHAESSVGFPDVNGTFYNLGRRSAGWQLWTMLDGLSPELASLMRREAQASKD